MDYSKEQVANVLELMTSIDGLYSYSPDTEDWDLLLGNSSNGIFSLEVWSERLGTLQPLYRTIIDGSIVYESKLIEVKDPGTSASAISREIRISFLEARGKYLEYLDKHIIRPGNLIREKARELAKKLKLSELTLRDGQWFATAESGEEVELTPTLYWETIGF